MLFIRDKKGLIFIYDGVIDIVSRKKIGIADVARKANVSITTVSRVINNVPSVSKENYIKVKRAIASLNFKPNIVAQRLARGINNAIGVVMPGYAGIFHSFYAIELIRGIGHACESLGLDMVFHITDGNNPIGTDHVDGIIFADVISNIKHVAETVLAGIPCLVINNRLDEIDISYIAVDNVLGGRIAAEYLVGLRHKRIAIITGDLKTQAGKHRFDGFIGCLRESNISIADDYIFYGDYSRRCARIAIQQFLSLERRPTAVFAASDEMALEMISFIFERGLSVPEDVSVIGFDDNPSCLYGPVSLTTIRQPIFKMAETAVHRLYSMILDFRENKKTSRQRIVLNPELVVRESCCVRYRSR